MVQSTEPSGCPLNSKLRPPTVKCADIVSMTGFYDFPKVVATEAEAWEKKKKEIWLFYFFSQDSKKEKSKLCVISQQLQFPV